MLTIQMGHSFNMGVMNCLVHEGLQCLGSCGGLIFVFKGSDPSYFVVKFSDVFLTNQQD